MPAKKQIKYLDFQMEFDLRSKEYMGAFERVMKGGVYILYEEVEKFEHEFAEYLGTKYCVGVANGLEALQISLMALGVGKGDEVITTPVSAVATTLAIMAVGANPIFADIKPNGQIDEGLIEKVITKKTKAILPVHLYGQPANINEIKRICKKNSLLLIEDACQAHGSTYKGKKLGTLGDTGCFSFYPTKNLGAIGDGGAIVTSNINLYKIIKQIRDYGQKTKYVHTRYGLNSRLDELQAAILREKLKYLEKDNSKRRDIAKRYIKNLSDLNQIEIILPENIYEANFHIFAIKTTKRNALQKYLKTNNVPSLIHYPATIPDQPLFENGYKDLQINVSRQFVRETLSLPCYPFMSMSEIDFVSKQIINFFKW